MIDYHETVFMHFEKILSRFWLSTKHEGLRMNTSTGSSVSGDLTTQGSIHIEASLYCTHVERRLGPGIAVTQCRHHLLSGANCNAM